MCADSLQPVASEGRSTVIVLDTNILLDLWVFDDARAEGLRTALKAGQLQWLATTAMRDELERVLAYPQIVRSLQHHGRVAGQVLAQFDALAQLRPVPPKAPVTCKDPDDQKFIEQGQRGVVHAKTPGRAAGCGAGNPAIRLIR